MREALKQEIRQIKKQLNEIKIELMSLKSTIQKMEIKEKEKGEYVSILKEDEKEEETKDNIGKWFFF
tara:strand:+ start:327 stop:527 length:201 start_codon:yes stop_codon:yes gene_type:complete